MQVILDSSFARPGSGPKRGGKNGEFRDWTNVKYVTVTLGTDKERVNLPCYEPAAGRKSSQFNVT